MESIMIYFIILTIATLVVVIIGMYRQLADAWTRVHVTQDNFEASQRRVVEIMEDNTQLEGYLASESKDRAMAEDEVLELRDTVKRQERQLEWWREQDNAGWTGGFDE